MRLHWTHRARAARRAIYDYIEAGNPAAALALDERFRKEATRLLTYPDSGRKGRAAGTRELVVHRHYIMVYDIVGDMVRVLRVLHTARQWPTE